MKADVITCGVTIFPSECKPEKKLAFKLELTGNSCLEELNHLSVFEGWRKDGTKSFVTRSTGGEISTASRPCAVAGGKCAGFLCISKQDELHLLCHSLWHCNEHTASQVHHLCICVLP